MGLTGFNKRRREAAALAKKIAEEKAAQKSTVSPEPKTQDNVTEPAPAHKVGKKATNAKGSENK